MVNIHDSSSNYRQSTRHFPFVFSAGLRSPCISSSNPVSLLLFSLRSSQRQGLPKIRTQFCCILFSLFFFFFFFKRSFLISIQTRKAAEFLHDCVLKKKKKVALPSNSWLQSKKKTLQPTRAMQISFFTATNPTVGYCG